MHLTTSYAANSALGTIYREEFYFFYLVLEVKGCTAFCKHTWTKDITFRCTVQTDMTADVHKFTDTELIAR
jgi:hypothetical protein